MPAITQTVEKSQTKEELLPVPLSKKPSILSQEGSFLSDFICTGEEVIHRSHPSSNECAQKIDLALCLLGQI